MPPSIAVIIATYNWPEALRLVLWGYAAQRDRDFRIIIADDGSGPETARVVDEMRVATGLHITQLWHEDRGWRKGEILNRAIVAAKDDYLILTDGDTIPRDDFVAVHRRVASRGVYAAGMTLRLPQELSARVTADDVRSGRVTDRRWLAAEGVRLGRHVLRCFRSYALNRTLDWITTSRRRLRGLNAAAFRDDLLAVNGFANGLPYGGMDAELGDRLDNYGLQHRRVRFRAMTVHLWHKRPWRDPEKVQANRAVRARVRTERIIRTPNGIAELDATSLSAPRAPRTGPRAPDPPPAPQPASAAGPKYASP